MTPFWISIDRKRRSQLMPSNGISSGPRFTIAGTSLTVYGPTASLRIVTSALCVTPFAV